MIHITNNTHPTLQQLNDNFFTAAERYVNFQRVKTQNKQQSGKDRSHLKAKTNLAVSVDGNTKTSSNSCVLCSQDKAEYNHIRGLKDEGSQCNFILNSISEELDLKVICNNVKLKVNEFNGTREYHTTTVKLNIDFCDTSREIEAICVPEININIKLPKSMEVTEQFAKKGYSLADRKLYECSESISEIDFILGSNSAYCLKSGEVSFGVGHTSIYANTSLGVMLLGKLIVWWLRQNFEGSCSNPCQTFWKQLFLM